MEKTPEQDLDERRAAVRIEVDNEIIELFKGHAKVVPMKALTLPTVDNVLEGASREPMDLVVINLLQVGPRSSAALQKLLMAYEGQELRTALADDYIDEHAVDIVRAIVPD